MCSMSVLCPLCNQTKFSSIDALRSNLIKAANGPLPCPICNDLFLGLDKLTIHLFSHTSLVDRNLSTERPAMLSVPPAPFTTTSDQKKSLDISNTTDKLKCIYAKKRIKKIKQPLATTDLSSQPISSTSNSLDSPEVCCDICELTFSNEQLKNMHIRLVHQNLDASSTAMNYTLVSGVDAGEPFKCHLCSKTFKNKGSLRVHLKVVHTLGIPHTQHSSNKFNICDRLKEKDSKITIHRKCFPPKHLENPSLTLLPAISSSNNSNPSTTTSSSNAFTFGTLTILPSQSAQISSQHPQSHQNPETKHVLNINSNGDLVQTNDLGTLPSNVLLVFNTSATSLLEGAQPAVPQLSSDQQDSDTNTCQPYPNSASSDNPKIWECDICAKSFTTKYFLKKHKRLHTGEMPYTCELCSRTFTFQQSYHKHLLYHSEIKPHVCATCGRAFKELSTLHNHERIHSGEKPFKCEVCGKSFRQRVSFLVHTRIHTGVMPYKCDLCQKSFRYKVSQRTHKCFLQNMDNEQPQEKSPDPLTKNNATTSMVSHAQSLNVEPSLHDEASHLSENFIKTFLEQQVSQQRDLNHNSPGSLEIATINDDQASLVKAIDDYVAESCKDLLLDNDNESSGSIQNNHNVPSNSPSKAIIGLELGDGSNSPSQQLQKMRLYSPQICGEMETNDNSFENFLLNSVGNHLV